MCAVSASAQQATPPQPPAQSTTDLLGGGLNTRQERWELVEAGHYHLTGKVEMERPEGIRFFADTIDLFTDTNRIVASGNVVFTNPEGRISAESVDFDLDAGTGTFQQASGLMSLGAKADRVQFGNQDPDVYFYGDVIDKLGPRRYRVTRGGFTTCVQPTPRWEVTSGSVVLNLNDYAIARNTLLRVKGVPLMYLPIIYYPIQDNDRATGFLLPTYGTSTFRGQALSNAFFWAIDRSQDATFFHDWFTRAGQGEGAEYRYVSGTQSSGNFRLYRFNRRETTYTSNGTVTVLPANSSYEITGVATQTLGTRIRARARLDYFSDVFSQQLLHQNVYQATRRNRLLEGGLTAGFGRLSTSMLYQRNEVINSDTETVLYGGTPRITGSIAPFRLFGTPIYASLNTEYAYLPYERITSGKVTQNDSFSRIDATPTIRIPLSRLTFLSLNTSASYRSTYYSRSADPLRGAGQTLPGSFLRDYMSLRTEVVGPVFSKIWDRPETSFAERMKHVIEPAFTVDVTSPIDEYRRTPILSDPSDFIVGGTTRLTYGLTNRFFYRGRTLNGVRGQTREFITIGLQQTYYSNPAASQFDLTYVSTNSSGRGQQDLSPVSLNIRVSPSTALDANTRLEYDVSHGGGMTSLSTGVNFNVQPGSASVSFSRRHFSETSPPDDYVTASTRMQVLDRRTTGSYAISWDLGRGYIVSQTMMLSYMAQCCGFQVEFQKFNFAAGSGIPIPSDRRLNFSFVLAGLGTFSNFFGAFGGQR